MVDVLPQVEEADPDKLYLVPMIDAWYNSDSLTRCFITQNERPFYADDFMAFGAIVVESGDAVMIGSDGTRTEVVMHEYETEAQNAAGDSKYHCSPETFHYRAFKIVTNEFGTFWGLAEAPSWVVEAE